MNALDSAANALGGAKHAADLLTPPPTEAPPAPPTLGERARATACEYTGMGCDVVEDGAQPVGGRPRHTTEATWFGGTEDGGVAVADHTLSDGSNLRIGEFRPGVASGEATLVHAHTSTDGPFGMAVDLFKATGQAGASGEYGETTVGGELSASLLDIVHSFRGEDWNVDVTGSVGVGAGALVSQQDADGDGRTEVCGHVAAGPVALDGCIELNEEDSARADAFFEAAYEFTPQRIIYRLCD